MFAYGAGVASPSPVGRYDPEAALGESALHIARPTPLYLYIYSPVIRADWRRDTWSGGQDCISCQLHNIDRARAYRVLAFQTPV